MKPRSGLHKVGWLELHLGTRVEISCRAKSADVGRAAVRDAFAEIGQIHRLMSFHEPGSDVSRLNRLAARGPVKVDRRTVEVIRAACELSRCSAGCFDISTAAELVSAGRLPRPASSEAPDPNATWRDIEILSENTVVFHRSLWLDLGGIAKGYAVDRALRRCLAGGAAQCLVNAGGDCRVSDGLTASVALDVPANASSQAATIELTGGSLASSCGWNDARMQAGRMAGPHYDGRTRRPLDPARFVSVLAEDCLAADALTKVVLSLGHAAAPALARHDATAFIWEAATQKWDQVKLMPIKTAG